MVAKSRKREVHRPSPQRSQYINLYRLSTKGLWSDRDIKATHECSRVEGSFSGSEKVQRTSTKTKQCWLLQTTVVAYINKQGGTHLVEMHALLWKIMTWCHHYQITLNSQAHSRVSQCDGLPSIQSYKQNGHYIHKCSNRSVKWFIPHVDLFATHLNQKVPLFVSPVPYQHAWDIDALNISGQVSLLMLTLLRLYFIG